VSCPFSSVKADLSSVNCQTDLFSLTCPHYPAPAVTSRPSCPACSFFSSCSDHLVFSVLSRRYLSGQLFRLSCPGCPILAVLSWLPCHCYPIPAVLSLCSGRPRVSFLPWLSSNGCLVLIVLSHDMFRLSSPGFPVLAIISLRSCSTLSLLCLVQAYLSGQPA
jgi:hypothetical protein